MGEGQLSALVRRVHYLGRIVRVSLLEESCALIDVRSLGEGQHFFGGDIIAAHGDRKP